MQLARHTTGIQAFSLELYSISDPSSSSWTYFPVSLEKDIRSSVPHPGGGVPGSVTGAAAIADDSPSNVVSNAAICVFSPDSDVTGACEGEAISRYHRFRFKVAVDLNERRERRCFRTQEFNQCRSPNFQSETLLHLNCLSRPNKGNSLIMSLSSSIITIIAILIPSAVCAVVLNIIKHWSALEAAAAPPLEPWFADYPAQKVYFTLHGLEDPPCPEPLLKAALFIRAAEAVSRLYELQRSDAAAQRLHKRGFLARFSLQELAVAEAELKEELTEIEGEAKILGGDEWAETITAQANEWYIKNIKINKTLQKLSGLDAQRVRKELG